MSVVDASIASGSPSPELWAGKSRNAKAQARHRAKRKAYIEQLEQTVSKLQTALALSNDDVANLPTAQVKLRELKNENDTLKAEIRKLQAQLSPSTASSSSPRYQNRLPSQLLSPAPSEEHLREPKKRKISPAVMDEYLGRSLQTYLGPDSGIGNASHLDHSGSRQALRVSVPPLMPSRAHLPPQINVAPQTSPTDGPPMQQPRDTMFTWPPFTSYQEDHLVGSVPLSWSLPTQSSHPRGRSLSGSSSSSMSDPPHLKQTHPPLQLTVPGRDSGTPYNPAPKAEDEYAYADESHNSASFNLPHAIPLSATGDSMSSATSEPNAWPNDAWAYSAVRMLH